MAWWAWMLIGVVLAKHFMRRRAWRWRARHMNPWMHGGGWGMVVVGDRRAHCGRGMQRAMRMQQRMWEQQPPQAQQPQQPPVELSASQKREQAIAELRRRYVADDITVEEYERELDKLLREA